MKVTIKDIASMAGVSTTTVSQILNNKGQRFSEETRRRVLKAVADTDYSPDYFAKNMVQKESKTVGMIVPDVTDLFFSKVIEGVESYLNEKDYMILLCNSKHSETMERKYIKQLQNRSVAGIILASPNAIELEKYMRSCPNMLIDRGLNTREQGNILVDEYGGYYDAVQYLIDNGHKKIGMLTNESGYYEMTDRYQAYYECLLNNGLDYDSSFIEDGPVSIQGGYEAATRLLARENLTALCCGNDQMAIGAYRAAFDKGLSIPDDISIVGFDNLEITAFLNPPLTTVDQPAFEIGYTAAKLLFRAINFPEDQIPNINYEANLIVRASTKNIDR
ncbi:LacI family transcriptional regulator [Vagococcus penaei]|uniref:LacI family transcriptional regulator n=1 Tax=Vagococcus penaei TaxID=633807 RepID=A0A1Q2D6G3_9ENTE|nr:LacI family DNA-binding transcriptional regulator [Vagococcus penaei]AQP53913.1 LacI family transcriptional regulator [Vagococcus penaei]RSU02923.1 LacI family transcriptional regulator [Vagococcus penaei]